MRLAHLVATCCFGSLLGAALVSTAVAAELERLAYRNPGLAVDLGVGLWAWPVPCDADGDGDFDLVVSCPDQPSNGVWVFENATGDTAQNKFPVFKPGRSLGRTKKYVLPSYVDGKLRVLTPGFEHPQFTSSGVQQSRPVGIPIDWYSSEWSNAKRVKVRHQQWRYVDFDGDGDLDVVEAIEDWSDYGWDDAWDSNGKWKNGPLHGLLFVFDNGGTTAKPSYAAPRPVFADGKPLDVFGCPTPNFEDFDGDGDLDLLCGEFLDGFSYFENIGSRTAPSYAAAKRLTTSAGKPLTMDLEMIVPIAFDWDRDGDFDLIVGDEDGRVALVENTGKLNAERTPQFLPPRYFQQQADTLKSGALATPVGCDWDGDGDFDLVSGNTAGYLEWFENLSGPGVAQPKWNAPIRLTAGDETFRIMAGPNGSIQGPAEAKWGYTTHSVADWDADGLPDVVFNSIWGKVEWLRNVGTRTKPKLAAPQPITVAWPEGTPTPKPAWTWWHPQGKELVTQWRTTPVAHDFNGDGLVDLALLDVEGYLCFWERTKTATSELILQSPQRCFCDEQGKPLQLNAKTAGGSGRRKLCVVDWDGDGVLDLLLNSTNAELHRGLGQVDGSWRFQRVGNLAEQDIEGHDVTPTTVDFDADGIPDFVGGAEDGRFYFLRNPRSK